MGQHKSKMSGPWILVAVQAVVGASLIATGSLAGAATTTRTTGFDYDPQTGLLTKTIVEPANADLCNATVLTYDAVGNIETKKVRNCNGSSPQWPGATTESAAPTAIRQFVARSETIAYDATRRFPTSSTNALGHRTSAIPDERFGASTEQTSPINAKVKHKYDGFGRLIEEVRPDGTITRTSYRYCSNAVSELPANALAESCPAIDALGGAETPFSLSLEQEFQADGVSVNGPYVKQYYSVSGLVLRQETVLVSMGAQRVVWIDYQYDAKGRKRKESRPRFSSDVAQWSEIEYDDLSRPTFTREVTSAGTATREMRYEGLITRNINPLGHQTLEERDEGGALVLVRDAIGGELKLTRDAFGNQIAAVDPKGHAVLAEFDDLGRRTVLQDPDAGKVRITYDAAGQARVELDAKGSSVTSEYDALGRLTKRAASDAIGTWTYDSCANGTGQVCEATADNGTKTGYGYDALGRLTSVKTTAGAEYTYATTYTASTGRPETLTYPSGYAVKTVYDGLGDVAKKVEVSSGLALWTVNARDASGTAVDFSFGNAVVASKRYHGDGQLLEYSVIGSSTLLSYQHAYKLNGLIASRTEVVQGTVESYGYDPLNRLTSYSRQGAGEPTGVATWRYDALGNLESKTSASGVQTQYRYSTSGKRPHAVDRTEIVGSGAAAVAYQYDSNGNLEVGGGRSIAWYSFQKPQQILSGNAGMRFQYSADLDKVVETSLRDNATVRRTVSVRANGETLYEETSYPSGQLTRQHFVYGEEGLVAVVSGTGASTSRSYSHSDYLGSVVANSNDGGLLTERDKYEPFGERIATGNSAPSADLDAVGFTGHEHLLNIGLIDMKGRIYDPMLGRFFSPDPLIQNPEVLQSYNRYSYAWNNPVNTTDPSGFAAKCSTWDGNNGCFPAEHPLARYTKSDTSSYSVLSRIKEVASIGELKPGSNGVNETIVLETVTVPGRRTPEADEEEKAERRWALVQRMFDPLGEVFKERTKGYVHQAAYEYLNGQTWEAYKSIWMAECAAGLIRQCRGGSAVAAKQVSTSSVVKKNSPKGEGDSTGISVQPKATRRSAHQLKVETTQAEAIKNLAANGYVKSFSKDGTVTIMTRGDKVYRFYPKSTGGGIPGAQSGDPSASVSILDKIVTKLRFLSE